MGAPDYLACFVILGLAIRYWPKRNPWMIERKTRILSPSQLAHAERVYRRER